MSACLPKLVSEFPPELEGVELPDLSDYSDQPDDYEATFYHTDRLVGIARAEGRQELEERLAELKDEEAERGSLGGVSQYEHDCIEAVLEQSGGDDD